VVAVKRSSLQPRVVASGRMHTEALLCDRHCGTLPCRVLPGLYIFTFLHLGLITRETLTSACYEDTPLEPWRTPWQTGHLAVRLICTC